MAFLGYPFCCLKIRKGAKSFFSWTKKEARWSLHSLQSVYKTKWQTTQQICSSKECSSEECTYTCTPGWPSRECSQWKVEASKQKRWVMPQPCTHCLSTPSNTLNCGLWNTCHWENPLEKPEGQTVVLPSALRFLLKSFPEKETPP